MFVRGPLDIFQKMLLYVFLEKGLDQPFSERANPQPFCLLPLKIKKGGTELPIALLAPMQVTMVDFVDVIAFGVLAFLVKILGGLCSGENPASSILKINSGKSNRSYFVRMSFKFSKYL